MSASDKTKEVAAYNDRALQRLAWAIEASQGQFSLIFAHCNYTYVQQQMTEGLRETCSVQIRDVVLKKSDSRLYSKIRQELGDQQPGAMMVFGLEAVDDIDTLLAATNQVREEFRKNFHFPLVLWINDEVQTKLLRVAPDFESWGTTREFQTPPDSLSYELIYTLSQKAKEILTNFPDSDPDKFLYELNRGIDYLSEFDLAWQDLQHHNQEIDPDLAASFYFMIGRNYYAKQQFEQSLIYFTKSLYIWQKISRFDWQGMVLFHIGLCPYGKPERQNLVEQCVDSLAQISSLDLANRLITQFARVLQRLHRWADLETLAQTSLKLHRANGNSIELAKDYGFLAEVALDKLAWTEAKGLAEQALSILKTSFLDESTVTSSEHKAKLDGMQSVDKAWYLLLLARAEKGLGKYQESIKYLERAKAETPAHYAPELYIRILASLRDVYFEKGDYLAAFGVKQERLSIEQQFGLRAFIGTGRLQPKRRRTKSQLPALDQPEMVADEIIASGRQQDINNLLERIGNPNHRLTVIYGPSGVGKSSLIYAGLVPILKQRAIGQRDVLPIVIRVYTDWVRDLGKLLLKELEARGFSLFVKPQSITTILQRLKENYNLNLLTVLIFDQFEELFVAVPDIVDRNLLFELLKTAIDDIPYTQVVLSLREEYLHYLLQFERSKKLDTINDILSKNIIYYLGNFPIKYSANFIQKLTNKAQFYLEAALSHKLVNDLAGELGEIRPIELQILGYQLQNENITTLDKYQKFGSYKELLTRFFEEVISECGPENKSLSQQILYVLTDEKNTRLLKTKAELVSDLELKTEIIDLILRILVSSGLVLLVPEHPADRYQLGHDYFVTFIRRQQGAELLTELEQEREQRKLIEVKRNQIYRRALLSSTVAIMSLSVLASFTFFSFIRAKNNEIIALTKSSEVLYSANRESLAPLIEALKAGKRLKSAIGVGTDTRTQTLAALQQGIYAVRESNRLEGYESWVNSVSFSPDGQFIATGSADDTVKLWHRDGKLLRTLVGHSSYVNSVSFSPDGQLLATGSADGTVKLWNLNTGKEIGTLLGHTGTVKSLSFSRYGKTLTTGSADGTVKLWNLETGQEIRTLLGQKADITSLSFILDGELIVSASRDSTVSLWDRQGNPIGQPFQAQEAGVTSISISPDGQTLVTANMDGAVILWNLQGQEKRTLQSSGATISSVSFSPDGQTIATGSFDGTVKLWSREGQELQILPGHNRGITTISFSPDGNILATASRDLTVRLWSVEDYDLKTQTLFGHKAVVDSVSFSPDGRTIATASFDGTVKVWERDGTLVSTLEGHQGAVISLSFSPDDNVIASLGLDGSVKLWKLDGTLVKTLEENQNPIISFSFSPDGKFLASAGLDGTVKLWSLEGKLIKTIDAHKASVYSVSFSPDAQLFASASNDGTVKLWNLIGQQLATLKGHNDDFDSVKFSPNGKIIATASKDGTLKLWNLSGEELETLKGHSAAVISLSFSRDGQTLATASLDGTIKLWNLQGQQLATLKGHSGVVNSLSFIPYGTILASGSSDGTVKLWSLPEGKVLQTLKSSGAAINSVSFSPDGKTLATASEDKTVMLWNIDLALSSLDELLRRGCDWAGDYLRNNPNVSERDRTVCEGIN
ncbi:WD-40 repeat-containing protein [Moorena producens 3L]|uniref:WD-40 repeat-containing protein n=2 Tax=Coleofasciculaceae TaxID=1892251 RepID=F4XM23_9CYAN|nr:WD-40 repeat-containing protein [Moorena producens 3L]